MELIAKIEKLKKVYSSGIRGRGILALDEVSLQIRKGEVFGLVGPNGAGKSTLIKTMLGLISPSGGKCEIFGQAPKAQTRARIGYLPEAPYFYKYLTGAELVEFYAKLSGMNSREAKLATQKALKIVGLTDAATRRLSTYSKGMTQRAGIAQAIVHNPDFVILDEPASGLDPIGSRAVAEIVQKLNAEGKTVLLCSHIMGEVEKLCNSVAILCGGKIVAQGNLEELLQQNQKTILEFSNLDEGALTAIKSEATRLGANLDYAGKAKMSLEQFFLEKVERDFK